MRISISHTTKRHLLFKKIPFDDTTYLEHIYYSVFHITTSTEWNNKIVALDKTT